MRYLYSVVMALLAAGSAAGASADEASCTNGPDRVQLQVTIPKDAPTGVFAPFAAGSSGPGAEGAVFLFAHPGLQPSPIVAQQSRDGRVWFLASIVDKPIVGTTLSIAANRVARKPLVTIEQRPEGFEFLDDGRRVMFYQREPKALNGTHARANYVHPMFGLDGEVLTQDFPSDHLHHRGVFWAWHQLWIGQERAGNAWLCKDFLSVVKDARVVEQGPVFATLQADVEWTSSLVKRDDGKPKSIVAETTTIRLFHGSEKEQFVDFSISLKPMLKGVAIGGSEDGKGYSGFTVRAKPPADMKITTEQRELKTDDLRAGGRWDDVSGRFEGRDGVSGIAILCHPTLPEFPPKWLLRYYGMQNVMYPGEGRVDLPQDKPLVLRQRLVIHRGNVTEGRIAGQQVMYEATP